MQRNLKSMGVIEDFNVTMIKTVRYNFPKICKELGKHQNTIIYNILCLIDDRRLTAVQGNHFLV